MLDLPQGWKAGRHLWSNYRKDRRPVDTYARPTHPVESALINRDRKCRNPDLYHDVYFHARKCLPQNQS